MFNFLQKEEDRSVNIIFSPYTLFIISRKSKHNPGKRYNLVQLFEHLAWKQKRKPRWKGWKKLCKHVFAREPIHFRRHFACGSGNNGKLVAPSKVSTAKPRSASGGQQRKGIYIRRKVVWIEFGLSQFFFFFFFLLFKKTHDHLACHAKYA